MKNYQNLAWHNLSCLLHIQKVLKWNPNSSVTLTRNLNGYFSTLRIFSGDTSICKERTWQLVRNLLNFLPQPPRMKSWYHDKVYDFQTLFAFYRILKRFGHTFVVMFHEQDVRIFHSNLWQWLKLNSITSISFFPFNIVHYSKHLQYKFEFSPNSLLLKEIN